MNARLTIKNRGFTLVECLVALAIYAVVIATLVTVTKTGTERMTELESHALARLALANVMVDVQQDDNRQRAGKTNGELTFGQQRYRWQVQIELSEAGITRIATGKIFDEGNTLIATQQAILVRRRY